MKRVHLVRHAESEGNVGALLQGPDTPLTEKGRLQARDIARRLVPIPFTRIVCSTMLRARETGLEIMRTTGKPIRYSDLYVERRRPSAQIGKSKSSTEAMDFARFVIEHFGKPGARYADEENFDDLRPRAIDALNYLLELPDEELLVVTHGLFKRVLLAVAVFGPNVSGEVCNRLIGSFRSHNTGLSTLVHTGPKKGTVWRVETWNDHSHLG